MKKNDSSTPEVNKTEVDKKTHRSVRLLFGKKPKNDQKILQQIRHEKFMKITFMIIVVGLIFEIIIGYL